MNTAGLWFLILGGILTLIALASSLLTRLPLTTAMIYLLVGFSLGPYGSGSFHLDPLRNARLLERLTEVLTILSLFTAGLKLRLPWSDPQWRLSLRLAIPSMVLTVGLVAVAGVSLLSLSWGAAIVLGGVLAPTDPVLASDVQIRNVDDRDRVRFALTGEAGFNDGTAFPFVFLGLGLLGLHDLGPGALRWVLIDLLWSWFLGCGTGFALGTGAALLVVALRRRKKELVVLDDFLALGILSLSYGVAVAVHASGFLAAFISGLSMRRAERRFSGPRERADITPEVREAARLGSKEEVMARIPAEKTPAAMTQAVLLFNEQIERLGEVGMVLLLGAMFSFRYGKWQNVGFAAILFLLIRPLSVWLGSWGHSLQASQLQLLCWFGIRGVGSLYYLAYAISHGFAGKDAERVTAVTLVTVASSIFLHGLSVTPLMKAHEKAQENPRGRPKPPKLSDGIPQ